MAGRGPADRCCNLAMFSIMNAPGDVVWGRDVLAWRCVLLQVYYQGVQAKEPVLIMPR
jgi:hypothetical protein